MSNQPSRIGFSLPTPPDNYQTNYMGNLVQTLSQNDAVVQKVGQDYLMYGVENTLDMSGNPITNPRLILISPGGIYFQILVDDSGNLTTLNLGT